MTKDEQIKMLKEQRAVLRVSNEKFRKEFIDKACDAYCKVCGHYPHKVPTHICRQDCDYYMKFRKAMGVISGNNEEIPSKNLQGFDSDYLQSKIDAFSEARKKDGKTSEELLNECRGGELLTWQDVKRILDIGSYIADYNVYHNIPIVDEAYYSEVLRRFKE